MKILIICNSANQKIGIGRFASGLSESFKSYGNSVEILSEENIKLSKFKTIFEFFKTIKFLRKEIKNYDITIAIDPNPIGILAHLATLGLKKRPIIHTLGTYALLPEKNNLRKILIKWAYDRSPFIIIINNFMKRKIVESGCKLKKYFIVPIGIDLSKFKILERLEEKKEEYILTVGLLKARKGYDLSVAAFAKIAPEFPNLKYVVVGGELNEKDVFIANLLKFIKENNLESRIIFKSNLSEEELIDTYRNAKLFVMCPVSTRYSLEGFGQVYTEAGLYSLPALGTFDSGAEEAIKNNETGILVPPKVEEITESMKKLLNNPNLIYTLGTNAKEFALSLELKLANKSYQEILKKYYEEQN